MSYEELLARHERERLYREKHLSKTQWKALDDFSSGHGIGDYSYLSWPTAKVLWRLGLIVIGSYWDERAQRSHVVGYITKRGWEALRRAGRGYLTWHEPIKAYGWRPWTLTRAQVRTGMTARLRAKKRGLYGSRARTVEPAEPCWVCGKPRLQWSGYCRRHTTMYKHAHEAERRGDPRPMSRLRALAHRHAVSR